MHGNIFSHEKTCVPKNWRRLLAQWNDSSGRSGLKLRSADFQMSSMGFWAAQKFGWGETLAGRQKPATSHGTTNMVVRLVISIRVPRWCILGNFICNSPCIVFIFIYFHIVYAYMIIHVYRMLHVWMYMKIDREGETDLDGNRYGEFENSRNLRKSTWRCRT